MENDPQSFGTAWERASAQPTMTPGGFGGIQPMAIAPPADRPEPRGSGLEAGNVERMFTGGLAGITDQLPADRKAAVEDSLKDGPPETANDRRAAVANSIFLADALKGQVTTAQVRDNQPAFQSMYATAMGWDEAGQDNQKFYGRVTALFQQARKQVAIQNTIHQSMLESFMSGGTNWKLPFTASLGEAKAEDGYDPKKLSQWRQEAQEAWSRWETAGAHYPAAVAAIQSYYEAKKKFAKSSETLASHPMGEVGMPTESPEVDMAAMDSTKLAHARELALDALRSVPEEDHPVILGMAVRGHEGESPDSFGGKLAKASRVGTEEMLKNSFDGLKEAAMMMHPLYHGADYLANQDQMRLERHLDATDKVVDPNTSDSRVGRAVIGTAEALPRMASLFHPIGVAAAYLGFTEEARQHFEDAGVPAAEAMVMAPLAGAAVTALQFVSSRLLLGKVGSARLETWMARNLIGKSGAALAKGYLKTAGTTAAIDTAVITGATGLQQLTEPGLQAMAGMIDKAVPAVDWATWFKQWKGAAPETAIGLVPLILIGTGVGTARGRIAAGEIIHREKALLVLGMTPKQVENFMGMRDVEKQTGVLQKFIIAKQQEQAARLAKAREVALTAGEPEPSGAGLVTQTPEQAAAIAGLNAEAGRAATNTPAQPEPQDMRLNRGEIMVALSSNPPDAAAKELPGLRKLNDAANAGDEHAGRLLSQIAADNLQYRLSGIPSVDAYFSHTTGLYGGSLESSLGARITFDEGDRAQVLSQLAKFADTFKQESIHVRGLPEDMVIGRKYADGSYNTSSWYFRTPRQLTRPEVEAVISKSGLYGLTVDGHGLTAYFVGDASDTSSIASFRDSIARAADALGDDASGVDSTVERLWDYGKGSSSIPYEKIRSDVPEPANPRAYNLTLSGEPGLDAEIRQVSGGNVPDGPRRFLEVTSSGTFLVKDSKGNVMDEVGSPEDAALSIQMERAMAGRQPGDYSMAFANPGMTRAQQIVQRAFEGMKKVIRQYRAVPELKGFAKVLNNWTSKTQMETMRTMAFINEVTKKLNDEVAKEAVSDWLQAAGDKDLLSYWAEHSAMGAKAGYAAALKLTPEQIEVAQKIRARFDEDFQKAKAAGILKDESFRENYVTQLTEPISGKMDSPHNIAAGQKLISSFKYAQERTFPNFFEMEQAKDEKGMPLFRAKTKDITEIIAIYESQLNKAIATRDFTRELLKEKDAKGALAIPLKGSLIEGEGEEPNFIKQPPAAKEEDEKLYRSLDYPALKKFWWAKTDQATGQETFMQGDIGIRADIRNQLENALQTSEIRKFYTERTDNALGNLLRASVEKYDKAQSLLKSNMLGGLSTFHAVHEMKRAAPYGVFVNPFDLKDINPEDPEVQQALKSSLMLVSDRDLQAKFEEGLGSGRNIVDLIGHNLGKTAKEAIIQYLPDAKATRMTAEAVQRVGDASRIIQDTTFHKLIPNLKMETWRVLQKANLKLYADEIAAGKVTPDDIAYMTSRQVNNRFGHLNFADLNRDPTFQHFLSLTTLAPDFWESNIRNYSDVLKGTMSKAGRGPAQAFAITAAAIWLLSRTLNQALDDDYHFDHPFSVVVKGREYTMRNEITDLWRMVTKPGEYVSGRVNPVVESLDELRQLRNWRGEKISAQDAMEDFAAKVVPISVRWLPGVRDLLDRTATGANKGISPFQQFLGSQGILVSRHSPLNDAFQLAHDWQKKQPHYHEDTGVYPTSHFQPMRYALEDANLPEARVQLGKLLKEVGMKKIGPGFHESLFRPWTSSKANDAKFKASLSDVDRAKVRQAEEHRAEIWLRFKDMVRTAGVPD